MTYQAINIGSAPDDGNGDPLRTAFDKVNDNFELTQYTLNAKATAGGVRFDGAENSQATISNFGHFGDGTNDYPFSGVACLYQNTADNNMVYGVFGTTSGTREWVLFTESITGRLVLRLSDVSGAIVINKASSTVVPSGEWVHVAFSYDGRGGVDAADGITLYINGVDAGGTATNSASYVAMENTGQDFWIGRAGYTESFADIHSIAIFNRALTASEHATLAERGLAGISDADRWATEGTLTSGTLTVGNQYRINTFVAGDDFTNVGAASNADDVVFIATGTTPTTWTNSSTLENIGATLALPMDEGIDKTLYDRSPNGYNATLFGGYTHLKPKVFNNVALPFGRFHISTPAGVAVAVAGTYVKVAGTTTVGPLNRFSMPTNNRLRYDGEYDIHAHIAVSVSMTSSTSNQDVALAIAKNGVVETNSEVIRRIATGSDVGSTAVHADVMMTNGDYIELWVTYPSSTGTITVERCYFYAMGMPSS